MPPVSCTRSVTFAIAGLWALFSHGVSGSTVSCRECVVPHTMVLSSADSSLSHNGQSWTTLRLGVQLRVVGTTVPTNIYSMAGLVGTPLHVPAAWQLAKPFGADTGGINPAYIPFNPKCKFDSWITVGTTTGGGLGHVGIDFDGWDVNNALHTDNGAVFWMNPANGPHPSNSSQVITLAQLTIPSSQLGTGGQMTMQLQGRSQEVDGGFGNWKAENVVIPYGNSPAPSPVPERPASLLLQLESPKQPTSEQQPEPEPEPRPKAEPEPEPQPQPEPEPEPEPEPLKQGVEPDPPRAESATDSVPEPDPTRIVVDAGNDTRPQSHLSAAGAQPSTQGFHSDISGAHRLEPEPDAQASSSNTDHAQGVQNCCQSSECVALMNVNCDQAPSVTTSSSQAKASLATLYHAPRTVPPSHPSESYPPKGWFSALGILIALAAVLGLAACAKKRLDERSRRTAPQITAKYSTLRVSEESPLVVSASQL